MDTFNKFVIITFDNVITVESFDTSFANLVNSQSKIDLTAAEYVVQGSVRHIRVNFKTNETLVTAIDGLISQGLPLRLEIQPDAFTFSSKVANATGSFAVEYFCKQTRVAWFSPPNQLAFVLLQIQQ